ncbi:MAG: hypothetical protein U0031_24030 [Thermomicrobiales bacterium]
MIALPLFATIVALACAAYVGWDAMRRPRPERVVWSIAFLLFAIAAGAEVVGALAGWTPALARVYYLTGAVLVVGLLALGELYLLFPGRMPAITPGITLLVVAIAATAVWSAPVDPQLLDIKGWGAIERGPALVALAALINAGGTMILVGGALWSAWKMRGMPGLRARALGCLLIAVGAVMVAAGGTLTRFGHREYLYVAMAAGIGVIFGGVLLTRRPVRTSNREEVEPSASRSPGDTRPSLVSLPVGRGGEPARSSPEGLAYIRNAVLPLDEPSLADLCRRWSATTIAGDALTREQARQVWALRVLLGEEDRPRLDRLPLTLQAQIAELYQAVWGTTGGAAPDRTGRSA